MGVENLDRSAVATIEINGGSGWRALGLIREEEISINGKEITHLDTSTFPFGIDRTILESVDIEIEFVWEEIADINLWNIVLYGGPITVSADGIQTLTNEEVTMKDTDWIALEKAADFTFDCPVTVTNEEGSTTYTEGIDYYLDRKGGHLKRITGGLIGNGQTVHVDYRYNTYNGKSFRIFDNPMPNDYAIRFVKPMLNGDRMRITHSRINFSSITEFPLSPGDRGAWAGVTSKIRFLKDVGGIFGTYGCWEIYTP